jgi:hypothetical protein
MRTVGLYVHKPGTLRVVGLEPDVA